MFQERPLWPAANDSTSGGQTPHTGAMNVGAGDGSVQTVSGSISPAVWARLCDPRDGEDTSF
jgi:prepilin-type processing-associated H-X9-DG protein